MWRRAADLQRFLCVVALCAAAAPALAQPPARLLVLPFDLVDTSLQAETNGGPSDADTARLQRTERFIRQRLADSDAFELVRPNTAARQAIEQARGDYRYLYRCNGCELDIARAANADLVMTGWVQKVSNLILNINATLRRADSGAVIGTESVDMRSDIDESWRRAARYLVERRILPAYEQQAQSAR